MALSTRHDGRVAAITDEGEASSINTGDLESGLAVTFETHATTTASEGGVIVTEAGASETFIAQPTDNGGQLIYVMQDASADTSVAIHTEVPEGYSWAPNPDGGASLVSADAGEPLAVGSAPRALKS